MSTMNLTLENFDETITNNSIVLIDFWASWCGPCKMFGPIFEKVSESHPDVIFAKVDTEAQAGLAGQFQISSIPTVMAFRDEVILFMQPGMLSEEDLNILIGKIRDVDMDEVRRSIAEDMEKEGENS